MSANSAIEWTDASWNIVTGCDRVSPGCDRCYIERTPPFRIEGRRFDTAGRMGIRLHPDRLDWPTKWRDPKLVFTPSLGDLFHADVPDEFIAEVFTVMARVQRHTYQVLTKRPQRMAQVVNRLAWRTPTSEERLFDDRGRRAYLWDDGDANQGSCGGPAVLPNVWLGTSIENDTYAWRANHLRATPAAVRWLSLEPLLGPLPSLDLTGIDWVVVGGESGPGARPMHPDWVRDIRDRCAAAGVPFFFKQWGEWIPYEADPQPPFWDSQHGDMVDGHHLPADLSEGEPTGGWWAPEFDAEPVVYRRVGKKAAGRTLDGRTWDQYPEAVR